MSMYRLSILNGVLVRQKRALLRWWAWQFNRSEEDRLTTMKNNLVKAQAAAVQLSHQIKNETERIDKAKKELRGWLDAGSKGGPPWRDRWSPRKEAVVLIKDINVARKKKERVITKEPVEVARLVVGKTEYGRKP